MSRAIVLTAAAVLVSALMKMGRRNRSGATLSKVHASHDSLEKFQVSANNLKAAAKKVDRSAAAVEVALKPLMVG